jgi:MYXO-CTERM domain-containing protein
MNGKKTMAVLLACLLVSVPLKARGDICYSSFVRDPVQEGQGVVLLANGVHTLRRFTETEMVEINVPQDIYTENCPDGWPNSYCYYSDCGHFRDECVPPGSVSYDGLDERGRTTWCCDPSIEVDDAGSPCLAECKAVAWGEAREYGRTIEVTLMTRVSGTLYRVTPCHGNASFYGYEETELADIDPEELPGQCRSSDHNASCCLPCGTIVDRCLEMDYDQEYYSYKFVPHDPDLPITWSLCRKVVEGENCEPSWDMTMPQVGLCPQSQDPDGDEPGGTCYEWGCSVSSSLGGPGTSHLLMVMLLLAIGFLALWRSRRP